MAVTSPSPGMPQASSPSKEIDMPKSQFTGSITSVPSDPHYGDTVTFSGESDAPAWQLRTAYYQNGEVVAISHSIIFRTPTGSDEVGLYSPNWTGGAASAEAWIEAFLPKGKNS